MKIPLKILSGFLLLIAASTWSGCEKYYGEFDAEEFGFKSYKVEIISFQLNSFNSVGYNFVFSSYDGSGGPDIYVEISDDYDDLAENNSYQIVSNITNFSLPVKMTFAQPILVATNILVSDANLGSDMLIVNSTFTTEAENFTGILYKDPDARIKIKLMDFDGASVEPDEIGDTDLGPIRFNVGSFKKPILFYWFGGNIHEAIVEYKITQL